MLYLSCKMKHNAPHRKTKYRINNQKSKEMLHLKKKSTEENGLSRCKDVKYQFLSNKYGLVVFSWAFSICYLCWLLNYQGVLRIYCPTSIQNHFLGLPWFGEHDFTEKHNCRECPRIRFTYGQWPGHSIRTILIVIIGRNRLLVHLKYDKNIY